MRGIEAKTRTARSKTIAFWYRSPRIRSPLDISRRRLDRTYSAAIRPTLSPTPPPGLRLYTAIAIESRGGSHRARHRARHGPGPGAPGDLAARPHDLRAHLGPDPGLLRRRQGPPDRQRLRLRVPPDDPPLRPCGHGRPRGRLPRRREFRGPARHGRPREAGRADAGGDPAPGARGPGLHVPSDDHINIGHAG